MGRVKIEVMPWLTTACGYDRPGDLILEEEFRDGETIREVIMRVAVSRRPLAGCILDPVTHFIQGYISIILNDRLISQMKAGDIKLNDGDVIRLLPTVDGG